LISLRPTGSFFLQWNYFAASATQFAKIHWIPGPTPRLICPDKDTIILQKALLGVELLRRPTIGPGSAGFLVGRFKWEVSFQAILADPVNLTEVEFRNFLALLAAHKVIPGTSS